jgi:hypothetical protein
VEGIVPRAAWHWGSVVYDPLGDTGLPSAWGSVHGDLMFIPTLLEGSFLGTLADINE